MRRFKLVVMILVFAVASTQAIAQSNKNATPEEKAFKFRTSLFQTFTWKLGQLHGAQATGDADAFSKHANDLLVLSKMAGEGFAIENSLPEGTRAKPEIWSDAEGFAEKSQVLVDAVSGLTEDGAMESFAVRDFATKNCGGCHREYRIKK